MLLTGTSDVLRVTTSTTADLDVTVAWADRTVDDFTPGRTITKITSTPGPTTIVGSPSASHYIQVKSVLIKNVHAATSNQVTVEQYDGSNAGKVYSALLLAGQSMSFDGLYWVVYDAADSPVQVFENSSVDVQTFTADGTWVKPTRITPTVVLVKMWGGGGGGAGGGSAAGTVTHGGSGGGGGAYNREIFLASDLPATVAVTVGSAGSVGAGGANSAGSDGGQGGDSSFDAYLTAFGGGGGLGGAITNTSSSGGGGGGTGSAGSVGSTVSGTNGGKPGVSAILDIYAGMGAGAPTNTSTTHMGEWGGGAGGGAPSTVAATIVGGGSILGGGGGGKGGCHTAALGGRSGSAGGAAGVYACGTGALRGRDQSGIETVTAGGAGAPGNGIIGGGGGGGGGTTVTASSNGGDGGAGGACGGGGGGGGACLETGTAGDGGLGGVGRVIVISW